MFSFIMNLFYNRHSFWDGIQKLKLYNFYVMNKRLFAIGDIHGCYDSLKKMIEEVIKLQKIDKLILLGDYIDRGKKSKEVIDFIIQLLEQKFDIVPLMGNHETMLLDAIKNEKNVSKWIQNGGVQTLKSFKISSIKNLDSKYVKFFNTLKYYYLFNEFLFVHAGFNDNMVNPFSDFYSMIWKCKESYNNPLLANKTVVHGHNPININQCKTIVSSKHRVINIDTGCVYKDKLGFGKLTAYDCNNHQIYFV